MSFSPVAIVLTLVGILAVIIGIKGSGPAVFQTLTGHATAPETGNAGTPFQGAVAGVSPLATNSPMTNPVAPHGAAP